MSSDDDTGDDVPLAELIGGMRLPSPDLSPGTSKTPKKPKPKKKKKKDPNEPQKPISAYSLFFKDTQGAIKGQNPNASFGEVSRIVASMWEGLESDTKNTYKKTAEAAKREYLRALAEYRAKLSDDVPSKKSFVSISKYTVSPSSSPVSSPVSGSPIPESAKSDNRTSEETGPQIINLADSPELTDGNGDGMWSNTNENEVHSEEPSVLELSGDGEEAALLDEPQKASDPQIIQVSSDSDPSIHQITSEPPVNGDIPDVIIEEVKQKCLRRGCNNFAIDSPEWNKEYCSSVCVVYHCRDIFNTWVSSRNGSPAC